MMGLRLVNFRLSLKKLRAPVAFPRTSASYDEARNRSRNALALLARYATITKSIILLSRELKKVQRRVNALEKIFHSAA